MIKARLLHPDFDDYGYLYFLNEPRLGTQFKSRHDRIYEVTKVTPCRGEAQLELRVERRAVFEYPAPVCMECGKESETWMEVFTGGTYELWVYCKACDVETFHPRRAEAKDAT